jgi:hypothetical protein
MAGFGSLLVAKASAIELDVHALLTFLPKHLTRAERPERAMKPEMTDFQAFAASLAVEGEVCDLPNARLWMQAAGAEIAPLIQRLGATSTAEIERLIVDLQEAKDHLQSESERIERETLRYTSLTQMASTTAKIISDAVSQWQPGPAQQKSDTSKATPTSTEDQPASGRADIMVAGTGRTDAIV